MRVFLDTNVLVSAVATRGLCADVLREVLTSHQLVLSTHLVSELETVMLTKFIAPQALISDFVSVLTRDAIVIREATLTAIDIKDQDDILILSTALNGGAELVVTGDKELLALREVQTLRIMSPREFWELLKAQFPD